MNGKVMKLSVNPIEFLTKRPDLMRRYAEAERKTIFEYWEMIRWTRHSGKLAENVVISEFDYWNKFEPHTVMRALHIHIDTPEYHSRRESYTRGIMRNLTPSMESKVKIKKNKFHNFDEHPRMSEDDLEAKARSKLEQRYAQLQHKRIQG